MPPELTRIALADFDAFCAALPHTTLVVQWGGAHVWKVGGKMFAIARLGGDEDALSFKATPQAFAILLESREFVPAPYLARAEWVALGPDCALPQADLHAYLAQAHRTVFAKLPRKMRAELSGQGGWQTKISRNG